MRRLPCGISFPNCGKKARKGADFIEAYLLPQHVHDHLLAEVLPVEKDGQGEPLFLEAQVDAWLAARYADNAGRPAGEDFMTIREVAQLLRCSYSEARDRMLDGRIRAIRDGRWLRTRREWVEQYVAAKTIKPPDPDVIQAPRVRGKRHVDVGIKFKKGGMGHRFLQERAKRDRSP